MDAVAQSQAVDVFPRDVQPIWLHVALRVTISRMEHAEDGLPCPDLLAPELDVFQRPARYQLRRAVVAQKLLDGAFDELGVRAKLLQLVGVAQQREDRVAQEVR